MADKFILDENGNPAPEPDLMKWANWFEKAKWHVGNETIGDSKISTVFLGLNFDFYGGDPVLWETMVFGGELNGECNRCGGTKKDAQAMHAAMVEKVKQHANRLAQ